jgi:hypothetical protein
MAELTIKYGIDERGVKATKENQSLEEEHAHWSSKNNNSELVEISSLEFNRCHYVLIALLAEPLSLLLKHYRSISLRHEK